MAIQIPSQSRVSENVGNVRLSGVQADNSSFKNAMGTIGNIASQELQRNIQATNLAAIQEQSNSLSEWTNKSLYGEGGLYTKKGKNALTASDELLANFDQYTAEAGGKLTNDAQKATFNKMIEQQRAQLQGSSMQYQMREMESYRNEQQQNFITSKQMDVALNYQDPNRVEQLVSEQYDSLKAYANLNGLSEDAVKVGTFEINDKSYGSVANQYLNDGKYNSALKYLHGKKDLLTPDFYDETVSHIEQKRLQAIKKANQVSHEARERAFVDLSLKMMDGTLTSDELDSAYNNGNGALTGAQYISFKKTIAQGVANYDKVSLSLATGTPLDPADKTKNGDVNAVNAYYGQVSKGWAPEDIQGNTLGLIKQTGIVPKSLVSTVRGTIRSGTADEAANAADLIQKIRLTSPQATKDFDSNDLSFAKQVTDMVASGTPKAKAVELALDNIYKKTDIEKETFKLSFNETKKSNKTEGWLENKIDKDIDDFWFKSQPSTTSAFTAEFDNLTKNYMATTGGDIEQARELAWDDVNRVWGGSDLAPQGSAMMKYSPEVVYGNGYGKSDWIAEQFKEDTKGYEGAFVTTDAKTGREDSPTYPVMHKDESGRIVPLMVDGIPQRWKPDYKKTKQYEEAQSRKSEQLEVAEELREYKQSGQEVLDQQDDYVSSRFGGLNL